MKTSSQKITKYTFGLISLLAALFLSQQLIAGSDSNADIWETDIEAARASAKAEGKQLMLLFHGSDWCPPCKALDREILSKEAFKAYVSDKYVLVNLDFPRRIKLSSEQKAHNSKLAGKYGIEGYPTVILTDADGKELDRTVGFPRGGYDEFVSFLGQHAKS